MSRVWIPYLVYDEVSPVRPSDLEANDLVLVHPQLLKHGIGELVRTGAGKFAMGLVSYV